MKYFFYILTFFSLFLVASCENKEKEGSLELTFLGRYEGNPIPMFTTVSSPSGDPIQFTGLSFYVSDVQIKNGSSTEFLREIELIDLSHDDAISASTGSQVNFTGIPPSSYEELRFGIGVPPGLNDMAPSDFSSTHPLSKTGYFWQAWDSYIFMKIEGRMDTTGNGTFDMPFAYHTGTDELYRVLQSQVPLQIEDSKTTELTIAIDFKNLLEGIDIRSNPQNHNPADSVQILRIVDNIQNSITLFP
jgi:hypothetical protein